MNQKLIDAQELYEEVLRVANMFLRNARKFELHILQDHKPTYAEIADIMDAVAHIIFELADDYDPMLAQKANDYVHIMRSMGIAIRNGDEVRLYQLVQELEAKLWCLVLTLARRTAMKTRDQMRLHERAISLLKRAATLLDEAYEDHLKAKSRERKKNVVKEAA